MIIFYSVGGRLFFSQNVHFGFRRKNWNTYILAISTGRDVVLAVETEPPYMAYVCLQSGKHVTHVNFKHMLSATEVNGTLIHTILW